MGTFCWESTFRSLAQQEREARQADGESGEARSLGIIGFDDMSGITAKIRYAAKPAAASLKLLPDGKILATFEEPQRAPTPGQSIVFYQERSGAGRRIYCVGAENHLRFF